MIIVYKCTCTINGKAAHPLTVFHWFRRTLGGEANIHVHVATLYSILETVMQEASVVNINMPEVRPPLAHPKHTECDDFKHISTQVGIEISCHC